MKTAAGVKLKKTHEHAIDRVAGTATLVRVNPTRDYGWNPAWNGIGEKVGDTERIIVQRLQGSDVHYFFTGDGTPLDPKRVPAAILDDLKAHPLVGEVGGSIDTICICKVCSEPWPVSLYPSHLEDHLFGKADGESADAPESEYDEGKALATVAPRAKRSTK
jgi:hypothetical protein